MRVYLVPAKSLKVRDPRGGHLPAEGRAVDLDPYWRRRLAAGDVAKTSAPKAPKPTKE